MSMATYESLRHRLVDLLAETNLGVVTELAVYTEESGAVLLHVAIDARRTNDPAAVFVRWLDTLDPDRCEITPRRRRGRGVRLHLHGTLVDLPVRVDVPVLDPELADLVRPLAHETDPEAFRALLDTTDEGDRYEP